MDNVGIVVDDLAATIDFVRELGLDLEGRAGQEKRRTKAGSLSSAAFRPSASSAW